MRALTLIITLTAGLLALAPPPAKTQAGDGTQLREFVARNAELLDHAAALVRETNSAKARSLLDMATTLHKQSVALLEKDSFAMAGRMAFRAREVIQQTIAVAKREARLEEQAARMMERAATRLEQARTAFEDTRRDDPGARRLIGESADNLRRAREQMQEHMFETSLRLAESSLALSTRAIRMLRRDGGGTDILDEIDRTQRVIDRVAEFPPSKDPSVGRLIEQAMEMQRRAVRSAERGEPGMATEQTRAARTFALRALRAARPGGPGGLSGEDEAIRAIALTDDIIGGARGILAENPGDALARRIEEAVRQQEAARASLDRGDFERALRLTTAAREMIRKALRGVELPVDPAAVEAALARTDDAIAALRDALAGHDHPVARDLLDRATTRQREARSALAGGEQKRSLALTRVAHTLARDGLSRLDDAR